MTQAPITMDRWTLQDAIRPAVAEFMNALAPDAPPLWWTLSFSRELPELSGMVDEDDHADPAAVAQQWAGLLGLVNDETSDDGVRRLHGPFPDGSMRRIQVWYIADRAKFDAARERHHARAAQDETDQAPAGEAVTE
ncbi:hypothetical protein [Nocardia niigatensis]|uniref:hypothetical protein n=1 Tax=Nocardia niigatensis TaxID=209249 RepID=UPI0003047BDF|nr:hypothetical protein [Nocardia niigatensis]